MTNKNTNHPYRSYFVGLDQEVPLLDGTMQRYINFDNAASTPAFRCAQDAINQFLHYYSSVHRGTGFKSQLSTHAYEQARHTVLNFVGANPQTHTCIFGKNTTEAVNKLSHRFPFTETRNIVLVSGMEHHSNDLPWRSAAKVIHIGLTSDGHLDETNFDNLLDTYQSKVALVAITGASNVTGILNPTHRLAEKVHAVGAQILVDCAQYAPHRRVDMLELDNPAHFDYVTLSGHKMYAPFGTGALVGRRDTFEQGDPEYRGGGEVEIVTLEQVVWSEPPERDEAGSPNTIGAVAMAAAICQLQSVGMDEVARHEAELTSYAIPRLSKIPKLHLYGEMDPARAAERLGVIPFGVDGLSHFLVASILGHEFGIGVRNGCFCAHPYILHLLDVTDELALQVREQIIEGDRREVPGLIRISFGLYNEEDEIDALVEALERIVRGEYRGVYHQDARSGEYHPDGWNIDFDQYFKFC